MSKYDAKLNKKEKELISVILSRSEDKNDKRGAVLDWKELSKIGFQSLKTKEQMRSLTDKILKQKVAFLVEKGHYDVEIVVFPVITKCRIMDDKKGGWTVMFSVSRDVLARNVKGFARIEAQNKLVDRYLAIAA